MMKIFVLLLLIVAFAYAQQFPADAQPIAPTTALDAQLSLALQIIVPLMFALVAIAVAVYMAGQLFGAETRAKATVWAHGVLVAVGLSAVIIVLTYTFVLGIGGEQAFNVIILLNQLLEIVSTSLIGLTMLLIVISAVVYGAGMMMGGETRARATTWATGIIGAAFFSGVLYVLFSQIRPQFRATLFAAGLGLYADLLVNVVFFVAIFILITYLLSKVFKIPEWEAYLSIEMSNLMSSFLIVLFVMGLFGVGSVVALFYSHGAYTSPPQAAITYMQGTVADSAMRAMVDVYKINACTSMMSTFARRIGEYVLTQTYKVFPGVDTFVSITNALSFSLLTLYNTAAVQVTLLHVIDALVFPFFLPAGLILRFFPPTRDSGAFLISLAFGFYVVFPMTYLINEDIFHEIGAKAYNEPGQRPTALIQSLCGWFKYGVAGYLFNPGANPIYGMIPGGQALGTALSRIISEGLLNAVSMAEFIPIMQHIADLSLLALFMPALSLMITISFINTMTKFIVAKV